MESPEAAPSKPLMAIYVHAGAGYHSPQNEHLHLGVCRNACKAAMAILQAGGTAIEAAVMAVAVMEDAEITNAGFGSNLTMEGRVESDAALVDHLGRSGACGAVPHIKNPIMLSKLILESTYCGLSFRRVPPNLLVGKGAAEFAHNHGMPLIRNELLVSRGSGERFLEWRRDLEKATKLYKKLRQGQGAELSVADANYLSVPAKFQTPSTCHAGQPSNMIDPTEPAPRPTRFFRSSKRLKKDSTTQEPGACGLASICYPIAPKDELETTVGGTSDGLPTRKRPFHEIESLKPPALSDIRPEEFGIPPLGHDDVVDTVGAIAIDCRGNIAAAASSGGIGMKHRGRVGPAALVGVGAAVIPCNAEDEDAVSIATITSGTGEHMATTFASQMCAQRLYHGTRKGKNGRDVQEDNEDTILESFIQQDFMEHPGVKNSSAPAAIGVLAVKKTNYGVYFYFSHNTDSFAVASMTSDDPEPLCVCSRRSTKGSTSVARGARRSRH